MWIEDQPGRGRRLGRTQWGVLVFLTGFAVGLLVLADLYLIPASRAFFEAKKLGDQTGTKAISATSALLLAVILFILVVGIILTFRVGRMFFPRATGPRVRTKYVDAWAESGKRMEVPGEGEDDSPAGSL
jgi:hypothetical protein